MQRQSIIVLLNLIEDETWPEVGANVETWGSLKEACTKHGWIYNTISRKKLPVRHKDWIIHRVPFRVLYVQEGGAK
jgi:hypothetical protein